MYKPNKRKVEKGLIANRPSYFENYGYEYTFFYYDHQNVVQLMTDWLSTRNQKMYKIHLTEGKPHFLLEIIGTCLLEIYQASKKEITYSNGVTGYAVSYVAVFKRWEYYGSELFMGDEMNEMLTGLELGLVNMDPYTWVRTIPSKAHLKNNVGARPEVFESLYVERTLTREAAAEKKLTEEYLADRLNSMGLAVQGGTPLAQVAPPFPNPLIEERVQNNLKLAEETKSSESNQGSASQGAANQGAGAQGAADQGAETQEERVLKDYPAYFEVSVDEPLDPFIHARIDEHKNIIQEPHDHIFQEVRLAGVTLYKRPKGASSYSEFYSDSLDRDNFLYVSDCRIAFINRKYNKKEAGGWVGFGGASAYVIGEAMNLASMARKAIQRRDKALAGHIRYEWIGLIGFQHKNKAFGHEMIRFLYKDLNRTTWMLSCNLAGGSNAELLANDIVRRLASYRLRMTNERSEETNQELQKYHMGMPIQREADPKEISVAILPGNLFATKGSNFRPEN